MRYALDLPTDDLPTEVRRVLDGRLASALEQLAAASAGEGDARATAVHEARKDLKKARSVVRLVRPGLAKADHARERDALRATARGLGGAREADALVETVDRLHERYAGQEPASLFEAVRAPLLERATAAHHGGDSGVPEAVEALRAARTRLAELELGAVDVRVLARGIGTAYERGTAAFAAVREDPSPERIHEWRKRVKDLWYQHKLIASAWPPVLGAHADEAKALSKVLGDDHDLHALDLALGAGSAPSVAADVEALRALARRRREELRGVALAGGRRLHAEKPKAYRRRVLATLRAPAVDHSVPTPD